ncbi:hypothetical protein CTA2_1910 [Colletotrichum tanaceti]|nr:hypothetical protein CTA2_1910 [Colletotrichum tanaceti]
MALNEPSLQELLAQPLLDLQFTDASIYDDGGPGAVLAGPQSRVVDDARRVGGDMTRFGGMALLFRT